MEDLPKVSEHLYGAEQHGSRIGHVLERQIQPHVPRPLLEDNVLLSHILSRTYPSPAHQPRPNVSDDVAIEIGHHHDVKLVWFGHQLSRERGGGGREGEREKERDRGKEGILKLASPPFCCVSLHPHSHRCVPQYPNHKSQWSPYSEMSQTANEFITLHTRLAQQPHQECDLPHKHPVWRASTEDWESVDLCRLPQHCLLSPRAAAAAAAIVVEPPATLSRN